MKQNFTVRQGALDGVEAFLSVALHRSFRRAATELGGDAVGDQPGGARARGAARRRAVHSHHPQRRSRPRQGNDCLARARPAFEELIAASGAARELGQKPAGLLRLTVPRSVVPILLEPLIASFCKALS